MAIKIMIADDHSMIREGLKSLLELEGDIQVVAEAEDGVDCLEKLKICTPDVLLLDINMPRKNGLEVLQTLKSSKSKVKVLVLSLIFNFSATSLLYIPTAKSFKTSNSRFVRLSIFPSSLFFSIILEFNDGIRLG